MAFKFHLCSDRWVGSLYMCPLEYKVFFFPKVNIYLHRQIMTVEIERADLGKGSIVCLLFRCLWGLNASRSQT